MLGFSWLRLGLFVFWFIVQDIGAESLGVRNLGF